MNEPCIGDLPQSRALVPSPERDFPAGPAETVDNERSSPSGVCSSEEKDRNRQSGQVDSIQNGIPGIHPMLNRKPHRKNENAPWIEARSGNNSAHSELC
jgi:hypothetical protein